MPQEPVAESELTELAVKLSLEEPALALAAEASDEKALLQRLIDQKLWRDATRLQAHLLGKPKAIWWGCLALREVFGADFPEDQKPTLQPVLTWLSDPTDANRRAAGDAANRAEERASASLLGSAVFFSGGSVSAPEYDNVPPPPYVSGNLVAVAVTLAVYAQEEKPADDLFALCLSRAAEVEQGNPPLPGENTEK